MDNRFFQRNTISNWIEVSPHNQPATKIRAKRAQSVSTLKIDPSKFQHREVFDSQLYQKVNFFRCGFQEIKDSLKENKPREMENLQTAVLRFCQIIEDNSVTSFAKNYSNLWSLVPNSSQKDNVLRQMTENLIGFIRKVTEKVSQLIKIQTETQQKFMKTQIDLKLTRKDFSKTTESMPRAGEKRDEKEREKKLKEKLMALEYALKKETLKSQTLEEEIMELNRKLSHLKKENQMMATQKEEQSHYKEEMEFKVKRLKEELEVAHIVKEQNLADKMKYIMNW